MASLFRARQHPHNAGMLTDDSDALPVCKFLIVDDHPAFRRVIRAFLAGPLVEVIECINGVGALEAYARHLPDWTLMDVEMPGMDGFSATREILSQFERARIVILTQHDSPDYREEALAAGACAFVCKDDLSQLDAVVGATG